MVILVVRIEGKKGEKNYQKLGINKERKKTWQKEKIMQFQNKKKKKERKLNDYFKN